MPNVLGGAPVCTSAAADWHQQLSVSPASVPVGGGLYAAGCGMDAVADDKGTCMVKVCCGMPCCSCVLTGTSVQCTLGMLKRGMPSHLRVLHG